MGHLRSFIDILSLSFLLPLLLAVVPSVNGALTNSTIDDTSSQFTFTGSWTATSASNPCNFCASKPDASQTFQQSWHDGNYRDGASQRTGGSFTFTGSAVYIYGIDQVKTQPNIVFTLGNQRSTHHYTGSQSFAYNALFFSATGLDPSSTHTVTWDFEINPSTGVGVQAALFDYAIVTSGSVDVIPKPPTSEVNTSVNPSKSQSSHNTPSSDSKTSSGLLSSSPSALAIKSTNPSDTKSLLTAPSASSVSDTNSNALNTSAPEPQSAASSNRSNVGTIIGAIIAVLVCIVLAILFLLLCRRRRQRMRAQVDAERAAAGLPPLALPEPNMRRIRAGNYTLQPFVDDRPSAGSAFAATPTLTSTAQMSSIHTNVLQGDLRPLRAGTSTTASSSGHDLPPAFADPANASTQYPPEKLAMEGYTGRAEANASVTRQPSQMAQSDYFSSDKHRPTTAFEIDGGDRSTILSLTSPSTYTSARERYLEERLATLEAHVANYLPPPYEHAETRQ
ncbi:hypothetical protein MIND_00954500 [Mycena indigotica]|uniref:Uncharacterized protein n=1 Tax=Mycena indigotica TaxID=2126181 RepID=A0A8H6SD31_9AGAR|nr:uncharacterized protein MIND_00954500 [Mycena indigotica]KAF7297214.1 hypothetical protein MIND_00954500 [Mycena indigotica]